jgi:hypothetical protein
MCKEMIIADIGAAELIYISSAAPISAIIISIFYFTFL